MDLNGVRAGLPVPRFWQHRSTSWAVGMARAVPAGGVLGVHAELAGRAAQADRAVFEGDLPCSAGPHVDLDHSWLDLPQLHMLD